jgi:hypothetical protein
MFRHNKREGQNLSSSLMCVLVQPVHILRPCEVIFVIKPMIEQGVSIVRFGTGLAAL